MSTATETSWLASNGLRLGMADGNWIAVLDATGRIVAEGPSVEVTVRRAKKRLTAVRA